MTRHIAIFNQKGGSGKTTTTVNLAAALGRQDRRVLVLDLDPQASASSWLGIKDGGRGLFDAFTDGLALRGLVQPTTAEGVDIIPSSSWLIGTDKALADKSDAETVLQRALAPLRESWQYILIDCPPTLGILATNALVSAREVLVPVECHVMSLGGLARLIQVVSTIKEQLNPAIELTGIVACRFDTRTRHAHEVVEELRRRFGPLVYETVIRENIRLAECPSFTQPIISYDPFSYGAVDYRKLAQDVMRQESRLST